MRINHIRIFCIKVFWCIVKGFPLRLSLCDVNNIRYLPKSTYFSHPYGITIGQGTIVGENCVFASNVTIGTRRPFFGEKPEKPAVIGNNVFFGAGCVILGSVVLKDSTIVGANMVIKG